MDRFCTSILLLGISLLTACGETAREKQRPMVYEGMPATELESKLGVPESIDTSGTIYDIALNRKVPLLLWRYETRVVLIFNDTVKEPDWRERK